jgi:hypothetical protein
LHRSFLLAAFLLLATALGAEVNQRVAVLRFELSGFTDSFAAVHIRNVFERELDRSDRVNLIREYLWSKFVDERPAPDDPRGLARFAMQAKVEAVVAGTVVRNNGGGLTVATRVFDALANRTVYTDRYSVPLSDALFAEVERGVRSAVSVVTSHFKPMEPREIVRYRKQTKKVFVSSGIPDWSFSLFLGADAVKPMSYLPMPTNQGVSYSNAAVDQRQFAAFKLIADMRWKRFSFTPQFTYGANGASRQLLAAFDAAYWLVPETVGLGLQFIYVQKEFTGTAFLMGGGSDTIPVSLRAAYAGVSSRFKASQRVGFGVALTLPMPLFGGAAYDGIECPVAGGGFPNFLIFADFGVTRSLGLRFNMDVLFTGYRYGNDPFPASDMSFLVGLSLSWRFEKKGGKP